MTEQRRSGQSRSWAACESADGTGVVRIEDRYDTDIDDLWASLTDPERLARWYGQVEGDLRPGGASPSTSSPPTWTAPGASRPANPRGDCGSRPGKRTSPTRRGNGRRRSTQTVEATLTADGDQTILAIEVRGMPLDKIAFYGAGWQIHAENLAAYLAGREPGDTEARWDELVPPYQDLAANIG